MIKIYRKQGWDLNPNDLRLNNIIRAILRNNGNCPCQKGVKAVCPCEEYRNNDNCHCGLYIKVDNHELVHEVSKE